MACTNYDNLVRGQDSAMYQNSYQGEGNPLTAGIYSLLIPNSEEEIQQVSPYTPKNYIFFLITHTRAYYDCVHFCSHDWSLQTEDDNEQLTAIYCHELIVNQFRYVFMTLFVFSP